MMSDWVLYRAVGHVQAVRNLLDCGLDPQACCDAPRWYLEGTGDTQSGHDMRRNCVLLEHGYGGQWDGGRREDQGEAMARALEARGHTVRLVEGGARTLYGRAQIIVRDAASGVCMAGSDPRADGCAIPQVSCSTMCFTAWESRWGSLVSDEEDFLFLCEGRPANDSRGCSMRRRTVPDTFQCIAVNHPVATTASYGYFVGASLCFGGTGIPMKYKSLKTFKVDPSIFSLYTALGLFLVNIPVLLYLSSRNAFEFSAYSTLGAVLISLIGYFSFVAVSHLGYARAPAIWAGIGMITASIWGLCYFRELPDNLALSTSAVIVLAVGVYCVSSSQAQLQSQSSRSSDHLATALSTEELKEEEEEGGAEREADVQEIRIVRGDEENEEVTIELHVSNTENWSADMVEEAPLYVGAGSEGDTHVWTAALWTRGLVAKLSRCEAASMGYVFCALTGVVDGSLMVPFKLSLASTTSSSSSSSSSAVESLRYSASLGLVSAAVAPALLLLYMLLCVSPARRDAVLNREALRVAFFPGVSSGTLWATANIMSVTATAHLGIRVGFPLTQTCVLVTALWGVCYFKELDLSSKGGIRVRFFTGVLSVVAGAYMLGSTSGHTT
ncbi:unnamed protein product [Sphagnum balticum]